MVVSEGPLLELKMEQALDESDALKPVDPSSELLNLAVEESRQADQVAEISATSLTNDEY